MCGIVGFVGQRAADGQPVGPQALDVVMEGLRRLEYRGYDSAGVALQLDGKLATDKRAGKLANLVDALAELPLPASTGSPRERSRSMSSAESGGGVAAASFAQPARSSSR